MRCRLTLSSSRPQLEIFFSPCVLPQKCFVCSYDRSSVDEDLDPLLSGNACETRQVPPEWHYVFSPSSAMRMISLDQAIESVAHSATQSEWVRAPLLASQAWSWRAVFTSPIRFKIPLSDGLLLDKYEALLCRYHLFVTISLRSPRGVRYAPGQCREVPAAMPQWQHLEAAAPYARSCRRNWAVSLGTLY